MFSGESKSYKTINFASWSQNFAMEALWSRWSNSMDHLDRKNLWSASLKSWRGSAASSEKESCIATWNLPTSYFTMDKSKSSISDIVRSKDIKNQVWSTMLALLPICLLKLSCITNTVRSHKYGLLVWLSMNAWTEERSIRVKIWEKSSRNSRKMDFHTELTWAKNAETLSSGASSMIQKRDQLV